jgi:hypothetical protein
MDGNMQRQAKELISGLCLGTKARFLSFNRIQSRVVVGLMGHLDLIFRNRASYIQDGHTATLPNTTFYIFFNKHMY